MEYSMVNPMYVLCSVVLTTIPLTQGVCNTLPQLIGAATTTCTTSQVENTQCTYTCNSGYHTIDGTDAVTITCNTGGTWNINPVVCIADCGTPPTGTQASTSCTTPYLHDDTCTYTCTNGYHTSDGSNSVDITCNNGAWSTSTVTCIADCSPLPTITGATSTCTSPYVHSETCTYTCDDGYSPSDGSSSFGITCVNAGWTTSSATCIADCSPLPTITGATSTCTSPYVHSETCTYTCNDGYSQSDGSSSFGITCVNAGWTTSSATCIADCSPLPTITGATSTCTSPYVHSETCTYTCDDGYSQSDGSSSFGITCVNAGWTASSVTCIANCGTPPTQTQATSTCTSPYVHGETCTYTCNTGYSQSDGSSTFGITCVNAGWTTSSDTCIADCSTPPSGTQASSSCTAPYLHGKSCQYTCNNGYHTSDGSSTVDITCNSGTWSSSTVTCIADCGTPPIGTQASSSCTSPYLYGNICTYTCTNGYHTSDGSSTVDITCNSGSWSSSSVTCIADCGTPPTGIQASSLCTAPYLHGKSCQYTCNNGYLTIDGSSTVDITCNSGTWSSNSVICIAGCGTPPSGTQASSSCTSPYSYGNTCTYTCTNGYHTIDGSSTVDIICNSGTWSSSVVICIADCGTPPSGTQASSSCTAPYLHGNTCTYTCTNGYHTSDGSSLVDITCNSGTWSSSSVICIADCGTPPTGTQASSSCSNSAQLSGTTCTYTCSSGYHTSAGLSTVDTTCNGGTWSSSSVICFDIDECSTVNPCQHNGICINNPASYTCNCDGTGYSGINCQTDHLKPEQVSLCSGNDSQTCNICWQRPNGVTSGTIAYYKVEYSVHVRQGESGFVSDIEDSGYWIVPGDATNHSVYKNDLIPYSDYQIKVRAASHVEEGELSKETVSCTTKPGEPIKSNSAPYVTLARRKIISSGFWLKVKAFSQRHGPISCYEVIVVQVPQSTLDGLPVFDTSKDPDLLFPPSDVRGFEDVVGYPGFAYVALRVRGNALPGEVLVGDGQTSSCRGMSSSNSKRGTTHNSYDGEVLNGELLPNTWYTAFLRAYVDNPDNSNEVWFSSSPFMEIYQTAGQGETKGSTSSANPVVTVLIVVIVIIVVGAVITVLVIYMRMKKKIADTSKDPEDKPYTELGEMRDKSDYMGLQPTQVQVEVNNQDTVPQYDYADPTQDGENTDKSYYDTIEK
ncbi:CUB and sushi domain-containing protein 3-like [Glandiceps talaboti]